MSIIWTPSPNFSLDRRGRRPIAIVDHKTAGRHPGCRDWLCNPASGASAHFLVTRVGEIDQLVKEENRAWHAGIVERPNWNLYDGTNPNNYTLGIEHEDYDGDGELGLTELQYQATAWLHRMLTRKWGIPVDSDHIIGHYRINSVNRPNCPGPNFPWVRLLTDLSQESIGVIVGDKYMLGFTDEEKRSYVPVRAIAEVLKFTYAWDEASSSVIINGRPVKIRTRNENGYAKAIELVAALEHGLSASWDASSGTVIIA